MHGETIKINCMMFMSSHCFDWAWNVGLNLRETVQCWEEGK